MMAVDILYPILASAAGAISSGAATEFAKLAGKEAFDALKSRLIKEHNVQSLSLLDNAPEKPDYAALIQTELKAVELERDPELSKLVETLQEILQSTLPTYHALEADKILSRGDQTYEQVEGIKAGEIRSEDGSLTFKDISLGKPMA